MVEGEAQGDQGSDLQDDEGDILQGLPYQLQEGFWLLWRYQVFPKYFFSLVQVGLDTGKTWERTNELLTFIDSTLQCTVIIRVSRIFLLIIAASFIL